MTLQEQLEIIQAAIDGKEIEYRVGRYPEWTIKNVTTHPKFNFLDVKYRIKPEPKKEIKLHQYLVFNKMSNHYLSTTGFFPSIEACKLYISVWAGNWQALYKLPHTEITITEN